jgi:hypothetical protein
VLFFVFFGALLVAEAFFVFFVLHVPHPIRYPPSQMFLNFQLVYYFNT